MAADLQLLQQNEANAGVSSEHIQLLQQQLELAKGEAHAEVARLRASLGEATASEAALRTENERLLQKLMDALALQAHAMDSEVQAHEEQRVSSEVQAEQHGQGAVWAVPQLGSCASSGHAWRLRAARYSQEEARPLGAQPFPRLFELVASNVTGLLTDVDAVTLLLHRHDALALWDYASAAPYLPVQVRRLARARVTRLCRCLWPARL